MTNFVVPFVGGIVLVDKSYEQFDERNLILEKEVEELKDKYLR